MSPRDFLSRDLRESVGEGRSNRPDDVATVERLLNRAGQPPFGLDREPTGLFSAPLRDSVRRFQREKGLLNDGIVDPDGETFDALRREISFEDESRSRRRSDTTDPDGNTQIGLRCRRIAGRLENRSADLDAERQIEDAKQDLQDAIDRVRSAEVQLPIAIANGIASVAGALAARNLPLAVAEAVALAGRLANATTSVDVESNAVNAAANRLGVSIEERDTIEDELARLEAERDRLGCASISL